MRSFFQVSVLFKSKGMIILMIIDVVTFTFSKKVKKVCFQNGNTICEHKSQILKYPLTRLHKIFKVRTLKKKEQKRARAVQTDFLKKLFFLMFTFLHENFVHYD